jgi:hypothetical protein
MEVNFCDQLDAPSFLFCNMYIELSPQHVSSTTALIIRRSQLYYAPDGARETWKHKKIKTSGKSGEIF